MPVISKVRKEIKEIREIKAIPELPEEYLFPLFQMKVFFLLQTMQAILIPNQSTFAARKGFREYKGNRASLVHKENKDPKEKKGIV